MRKKADIFGTPMSGVLDGFHIQAVVFSRGKAVGLIVQPLGSPSYFEPLSDANSAKWRVPFGFIAFVVTAQFWGWLLLPAQAIVLLLWLRKREKTARYFVYEI
jgi:hypothetical protein